MNTQEKVDLFLRSETYGVVGASPMRHKYGNKVLRCYMQNHYTAYPVHPIHKEIEHLLCYPSVSELPDSVKSISIITPHSVTERVVEEAAAKGIQNIWMQPGAESAYALELCKKHDLNVIAGGPCILVILGFNESLTS